MPALDLCVTWHHTQSNGGMNAIEHQLQYRPGIAGSSVEHFNFEVIRYILYSPISVIVLRNTYPVRYEVRVKISF